MAVLILSNTSGQVDSAIKESWQRTSGSYVGPTGTNSVGFGIRAPDQSTGLLIQSSCINFCKNTVDFKQSAANVIFCIPNSQCFIATGNGSAFYFNQEGTVSFGSGIDSNYKGIQSYSVTPSLVLRNTQVAPNHSLRFLNSSAAEFFNICLGSNSGTYISGRSLELITAGGSLMCLSGDNVSFNAPINTSFNYFKSGSSYFSGDVYLRGNTTGSGLFCQFNSTAATTGLDISTHSIFRCSVRVENSVLSVTGTNSCIFSSNCICSPTGCFATACGTTACYSNFCGNFCVNNFGCFGANGLVLTGAQTHGLSGICATGLNLGSVAVGCVRAFTPNGFGISGSTIITGSFLATGAVTHCIYGNTICLNSTDALGTLICGPILRNSGNFCSLNTGFFQAICSHASASTSTFAGPVTFSNSISAQAATFTNLTGTNLIGNVLVSGATLCFQTLCSSSEGVISLPSMGLVFTKSSGYVEASNTAKAAGIITFNGGASASYCSGYNLKDVTIYAQSASNCVVAYGIRFCNAIKYPFSVNFNVYSLNNPIMCGVNAPTSTVWGFTGHATTTTTVASPSAATAPLDVEFYSANGKTGTNAVLTAFTNGQTYCEIFFNFRNSKGLSTPFSELIRTNASGNVHFNIFSF